jgi:uncharacterized protein (DUF2267 family)
LSILAHGLSATRPVGAEDAARVVFRTLNRHVDPGQIEKVRHGLPEEVRTMWPEPNMNSRHAETLV